MSSGVRETVRPRSSGMFAKSVNIWLSVSTVSATGPRKFEYVTRCSWKPRSAMVCAFENSGRPSPML